MTAITSADTREKLLERARNKLYSVAGGSIDSANPRLAVLTQRQRIGVIDSVEVREYVDCLHQADIEPMWGKDVDKTQGAGDAFSFFFKERADNGWFSPRQLRILERFVRDHKEQAGWKRGATGERAPHAVLKMFTDKLQGKPGIGLLDFWTGAYWPLQRGLTPEEKDRQVKLFAPKYAERVYPGVKEENELLESMGVHVVIVSNGDQELAKAIAPYMGVKPENVVGSHLKYKDGIATGVNHSYEILGPEWDERPQPGKNYSWHYWAHANRARFGWKEVDLRKFVFLGRDGDSASSDGGMMINLPPVALGNFMIDTPGEPERIKKMYRMIAKYASSKGQYFTLKHEHSLLGAIPG